MLGLAKCFVLCARDGRLGPACPARPFATAAFGPGANRSRISLGGGRGRESDRKASREALPPSTVFECIESAARLACGDHAALRLLSARMSASGEQLGLWVCLHGIPRKMRQQAPRVAHRPGEQLRGPPNRQGGEREQPVPVHQCLCPGGGGNIGFQRRSLWLLACLGYRSIGTGDNATRECRAVMKQRQWWPGDWLAPSLTTEGQGAETREGRVQWSWSWVAG